MRATVVVFPVPGPPATTVRCRSTAVSSGAALEVVVGQRTAVTDPRRALPASIPAMTFDARASRSVATCRSSRQ